MLDTLELRVNLNANLIDGETTAHHFANAAFENAILLMELVIVHQNILVETVRKHA